MKIQIGADIVYIPKFKKTMQQAGQTGLQKLFSVHELAQSPSIESLAGIFAAKEATMKALGLHAGQWHAIEVTKLSSGKPYITAHTPHVILSHDVSISHDHHYVYATSCWLLA